ncbi:MAG: 16S rRNA (guanine(527)-N(7))-methyltransferase RsmG [Pigmentiphaga sp.]
MIKRGQTWEARLQADAAAMGIVVSDVASQQMRQYLEQLHRWNRTYNLTAVRDFEEMRVQHLLDSLSILPLLERETASLATRQRENPPSLGFACRSNLSGVKPSSVAVPVPDSSIQGEIKQGHLATAPKASPHHGGEAPADRLECVTASAEFPRILDVGSGGGLPGVVIAIQKPDWQVTCVDAVAKKTAFIQQMAGVLRLPGLAARHARIEQLRPQGSHLIVSRAFASLTDFVQLVREHLAPGGRLVAMKGKYPDDELADLARSAPGWCVESFETLEVAGLDAQRCVLVLAPPGTDTAVANGAASPDSPDRN